MSALNATVHTVLFHGGAHPALPRLVSASFSVTVYVVKDDGS